MAVVRPIVWNTNSLYQMTDNELDTLSYYVRKRYAHYLNTSTSTTGRIEIGDPGITGFVAIGGATDTDRLQHVESEPNDNTPSGGAEPDTNFGDDPEDVETTSTFYYMQNNAPALISSTSINSHGVLFWNSDHLKIGPTSETDLLDTIVTDAISEIRTGDEVGSYFVASSSPAGGTYVSKGVFFTDTIFPNTTRTTYNLWLKTANTTEPTSANDYATWDSSNNEIQLIDVDDFTNYLIDSIFVNVLQRNCPLYSVVASLSTPANTKSTFYDTGYSSTTNTLTSDIPSPPSGGTYTRTFTPSGSFENKQGPFHLIISGERSP